MILHERGKRLMADLSNPLVVTKMLGLDEDSLRARDKLKAAQKRLEEARNKQ